jgi:hypothetical protein
MMARNYVTVERCGSSEDDGSTFPYGRAGRAQDARDWILGDDDRRPGRTCQNEARVTSVDQAGRWSRTCTIHAPTGALSVSDDKIPDLLIAMGRLLDDIQADHPATQPPNRADLCRDLRGIIGKTSG